MGKPMKNPQRTKDKADAKRELARSQKVELINKALEEGAQTKKDLAAKAGMRLSALKKLFKEEKELYAKYLEELRTIKDIATDNMFDVVDDKAHPKNYDASKHVLKHFKSDIDDVLDSKDDDTTIKITNATSSRKRITFGVDGDSEEK